jgi:hypothetical protein
MLGVFCTALLLGAVSVYVFHDVDRDQAGHLNEAFAGLCGESFLFTVVIGGGVALITLLGRHIFRLKGRSPRPKLGLYLGIGVVVVQYLWDYIGRSTFPGLAGSFLTWYLILAVVVCSVVILRDASEQMRSSPAPMPSPEG